MMEITPVSGIIVQVSYTMVSKVLWVLYPECGILNGVPRMIMNTIYDFNLKNTHFSGKGCQSFLMKIRKNLMLISYIKIICCI